MWKSGISLEIGLFGHNSDSKDIPFWGGQWGVGGGGGASFRKADHQRNVEECTRYLTKSAGQ